MESADIVHRGRLEGLGVQVVHHAWPKPFRGIMRNWDAFFCPAEMVSKPMRVANFR